MLRSHTHKCERAQEIVVSFRRLREDDFNDIIAHQPPKLAASPERQGNTAGVAGSGGSTVFKKFEKEAGSIPKGRLCERPFAHALQDARGYRQLITDHASDVQLRCRMSYWRRSAVHKLAFDNLAAQLSVALRVKCQELSAILEMQARMLPTSFGGEGGGGEGQRAGAGGGGGEGRGGGDHSVEDDSGGNADGDGCVKVGADKDARTLYAMSSFTLRPHERRPASLRS